jgi:hypothetical protein
LNWYKDNDRSFPAFVSSRLCQKHQQDKKTTPSEVFSTLRKCCSKDDKFLTGNLPLLEGVFRLVLAKSNEPISLDSIVQKLSELRGIPVDGKMLQRLLDSDKFYGLRLYTPVETKEKRKR